MRGDRIIGGLDIDTYTSAPLRVSHTVYFDAPPGALFAVISNHTKLDEWMPLVNQVNLNRRHADVRDGAGTIRYLHIGPFTIQEYVIAFDPPRLMAYSIEQHPLIVDHVSVVYLMPERYGGTYLEWQHYFRTNALASVTGPAASLGLRLIYAGALRRLIARFDGKMVNRPAR